MKAEIRRLRTPQGIIPHTSTATPEVNVPKAQSTDFPSLTVAVQAPINGPATFAMAVNRNLPDTKLNSSDRSKPTTVREQTRSYQPKLRTLEVVSLYFRITRSPTGALRRSLGTVLLRSSMINHILIVRETLEIPCPILHKEKVILI